MNNTTLEAAFKGQCLLDVDREQIWSAIRQHGSVIIRGFDADLERFSELTASLCSRLTFDPARNYSSAATQKVDAGVGPIGLHVENGNTPFLPDVVAFFSRKSARTGSQTTVCDGARLLDSLPDSLRTRFEAPMVVSRTLPEKLWREYASVNLPELTIPEQVDQAMIDRLMTVQPGQSGRLNRDGSLHYELELSPLINSDIGGVESFANAILGPSHNYEPPVYRLQDGSIIDQELMDDLAQRAEAFTVEIPWQDNDVAIIDNRRTMHGRRAITDASRRELFIGMGMV